MTKPFAQNAQNSCENLPARSIRISIERVGVSHVASSVKPPRPSNDTFFYVSIFCGFSLVCKELLACRKNARGGSFLPSLSVGFATVFEFAAFCTFLQIFAVFLRTANMDTCLISLFICPSPLDASTASGPTLQTYRSLQTSPAVRCNILSQTLLPVGKLWQLPR